MEDKLFDVLEKLNLEETSLLLDKKLTLTIDTKVKNRIAKSVKEKAGLHVNNGNSFINCFKHYLNYVFPKNKLVLAFSLIFLLFSSTGYILAKTPVTYISLDINPSIEIGLNTFKRVVSYEAYNQDGSKILTSKLTSNISADSAISNLVENSIKEEYINKNNKSFISIAVATNNKNYKDFEKHLKYIATETLQDNDIVCNIDSVTVPLSKRDESKSLGLTPGKLYHIEKLQSLDPNISIDKYKDQSMSNIQIKYKELLNNDNVDDNKDDQTNDSNPSDNTIINKDSTNKDINITNNNYNTNSTSNDKTLSNQIDANTEKNPSKSTVNNNSISDDNSSKLTKYNNKDKYNKYNYKKYKHSNYNNYSNKEHLHNSNKFYDSEKHINKEKDKYNRQHQRSI